MERKRARLPHSERLIWPTVIFTSHGAAANAPIANKRDGRCLTNRMALILSAIKIPKTETDRGAGHNKQRVNWKLFGTFLKWIWGKTSPTIYVAFREKETAIFATQSSLHRHA